jgi:hypothetical protein
MYHRSRIVWAGDYADEERNQYTNLYGMLHQDENKFPRIQGCRASHSTNEYPFVVNHTRKLWVDMRTAPKDERGWQLHPLPILTCEGNGRGGGDYRGDYKHVGTWARHVISLEAAAPDGYTELPFTAVNH